MAESTASQSVGGMNNSLGSTFYKDKMGIDILKEHLQYYFLYFTEKS
jgi:polysaccharide deacetylase 2 family uncharacterized protein YibQ